MSVRVQAVEPAAFPATVVIDTREQRPYSFVGLRGAARIGRPLLSIPTARGTLKSGDYSLAGHELAVAVERKSVEDFYGTLAKGRERFVRELARLDAMACATVVVEGEWAEVLAYPGQIGGQLSPANLFRSVVRWQQQFRGVHWLFLPGRDAAEQATFRVLELYLRGVGRDDRKPEVV